MHQRKLTEVMSPAALMRHGIRARPPASLRGRLARWIAAVLGVSLVASSAVRVLVERRHVLESERQGANSFLERLVATPNAFRNLGQARAELETVNRLVRPWSAQADIVALGAPTPPGTALLVSRPIQLTEGAFELRYRVSDAYVSAAVRRTVMFYALHGALTFLVIMVGIDWILRRRLRDPLHELAHQIDHMRAGGGWQPVLPATDAECAEIASSVRELGPGLAGQVEMWIEGEKRAAIAVALGRLRRGLLESRQGVPHIRDVHSATPGGVERDLEAVERLIDSVENDLLQRRAVSSAGGLAPAKA